MNCRFKSIFSPYGIRRLANFFVPITLRVASELAIKYKLPNIKWKKLEDICLVDYSWVKEFPQHIQNQVIRTYCIQNNFEYLLNYSRIFNEKFDF